MLGNYLKYVQNKYVHSKKGNIDNDFNLMIWRIAFYFSNQVCHNLNFAIGVWNLYDMILYKYFT